MRFFNKRKQTFKPFKQVTRYSNSTTIEKTPIVEEKIAVEENIVIEPIEVDVEEEKTDIVENNVETKSTIKNKRKKKSNMDTKEKVELASQILNNSNNEKDFQFKRIKKDKGLIERTESSKTIITEDNRELLVD